MSKEDWILANLAALYVAVLCIVLIYGPRGGI